MSVNPEPTQAAHTVLVPLPQRSPSSDSIGAADIGERGAGQANVGRRRIDGRDPRPARGAAPRRCPHRTTLYRAPRCGACATPGRSQAVKITSVAPGTPGA